MPQPAIPDNFLDSTNTIGLPDDASREGSGEVVNLNSGSLTMFLPLLTLPQGSGVQPLTLGFSYDSNQTNVQKNVVVGSTVEGSELGACNDTCDLWTDSIGYYVTTGQMTTTGLPIDLNVPQLIGSLEYEGDYAGLDQYSGRNIQGPRMCITNVGFRDWKGTIHTFPRAIIACSSISTFPATLVLQDISGDNSGYFLDATNALDTVVYAPDGTAYHFANAVSNITVGTPSSTNYDLGFVGSSAEQSLHQWMSSSVDKFGRTMTFSSNAGGGVLTDIVGRQIQIATNPGSGTTTIQYQDSNGASQTISVTPSVPAQDATIPQATGHDVGFFFGDSLVNLAP